MNLEGGAATITCGVDEAGRGPLAGAVFAAAVILDPDQPIDGLADSKKLSEVVRERLALSIKARSRAWAIASASPEEIDALNILQASLLAMERAVKQLACVPAEVLVDGLHCPKVAQPTRAIVRGDATVPEIAAASILAKTARDAEMLMLHEKFPQYGFDRHKGYPTAVHLARLAQHGPCPVHRVSFGPVRRVMEIMKKQG